MRSDFRGRSVLVAVLTSLMVNYQSPSATAGSSCEERIEAFSDDVVATRVALRGLICARQKPKEVYSRRRFERLGCKEYKAYRLQRSYLANHNRGWLLACPSGDYRDQVSYLLGAGDQFRATMEREGVLGDSCVLRPIPEARRSRGAYCSFASEEECTPWDCDVAWDELSDIENALEAVGSAARCDLALLEEGGGSSANVDEDLAVWATLRSRYLHTALPLKNRCAREMTIYKGLEENPPAASLALAFQNQLRQHREFEEARARRDRLHQRAQRVSTAIREFSLSEAVPREELTEERLVAAGDLNGDDVPELVVGFSLLWPGGKAAESFVAVLSSDVSAPPLVTKLVGGGTMFSLRLDRGDIVLGSRRRRPQDSQAGGPSIEGEVRYRLKGQRITIVKEDFPTEEALHDEEWRDVRMPRHRRGSILGWENRGLLREQRDPAVARIDWGVMDARFGFECAAGPPRRLRAVLTDWSKRGGRLQPHQVQFRLNAGPPRVIEGANWIFETRFERGYSILSTTDDASGASAAESFATALLDGELVHIRVDQGAVWEFSLVNFEGAMRSVLAECGREPYLSWKSEGSP